MVRLTKVPSIAGLALLCVACGDGAKTKIAMDGGRGQPVLDAQNPNDASPGEGGMDDGSSTAGGSGGSLDSGSSSGSQVDASIAPGSVTVTIDGVKHIYSVATWIDSIDDVHVSFYGSDPGTQPPYPLVITPPSKTFLGTVKCGETNLVLLSFSNPALAVDYSSVAPCSITQTKIANAVGERWQGTFEGKLELDQPAAMAAKSLVLSEGSYDVPRTF